MSAAAPPPEAPIAGATTLEVGDALAAIHARMPLLATRLAALWLVLLAIMVMIEAYDAPASSTGELMLRIAPFAAGGSAVLVGLGVAFGYLVQALAFRRLPRDNRVLRYAVDASGLQTRDAAGAQLFIPWTMARRVWATRTLFVMQLPGGVIRYAPLRAFAEADRPRLLALARAGATT
ncbi:MAG: hypothetical protein IPL88_05245 [Rhizobiales bacterium]|nr:hypothetical protein [Hyphomicrobiales bacterium]